MFKKNLPVQNLL